MKTSSRTKIYENISKKLACLSDVDLLEIIKTSKKNHTGIGGSSVKLVADGKDVFTKLIPLTDLESKDENRFSTKNIFDLPLCYQYGVGSSGFGVWRELASSKSCSDWVLTGACANFPILYHYRILPDTDDLLGFDKNGLEEHARYWESNNHIKERYAGILAAKSMVVLFLEYIPFKLEGYLTELVRQDVNKAEEFTRKILKELVCVSRFMSHNGMVHFDGHFDNILTDGNDIYFADHGLALSTEFDLSTQEKDFLIEHKKFDECFSILNLLWCLITAFVGKDKTLVLDLIDNKKTLTNKLLVFVVDLIDKYGELAVVLDKFYQDLQKVSKNTKYPKEQLEKLLLKIEKL